MSVNGISSMDFGASLLLQRLSAGQASTDSGDTDAAQDFLSSLRLRIAEMRTQTFDALLSLSTDTSDGQDASGLGAIVGAGDTATSFLDQLTGTSGIAAGTSGRNTALFDPESAYGMMTLINARDVNYKAEFAEMSDMKSFLDTMREEGKGLGGIDAATTNDEIRQGLQGFVTAYNGWIERFDQDLEPGGMLAGTQAAGVAQWELEQSVVNFFTGAGHGFHGMRELGLDIDSVTDLASIDNTRLDAALATNKTGVVDTLRDFSASFARAAELLNSEGNFISSRLDNLDRVIDYLDDNKSSLQTEFGLGDAAKPSGLVAQALARYEEMQGLAG